MSQKRPYTHLVVVGASAGGIEALSTLVSSLPASFPAPIVIAQHLDPNRPSYLGEILSRRTELPVRTVTEHEPLEAGTVFVVPSNRHVHIDDSHIEIQGETGGRPKPSIDLLLSTAAGVYGEDLIAVVLTGNGSDGAAGARDVKRAGGTVVIQNPDTTNFPSMPRSLAPNTVDVVADLERVGAVLEALLRGDDAPLERPREKKLFETLLDQLRERNGIDFSRYKTPTIGRRLQRRIVATGSGDLRGYMEHLDAHPEEYQHLLNSLLINVTEFFRDPDLYDHLRDEIIPELIAEARERGNELRIWSAGCATGEEAYSLAILVAEALGPELDSFGVRIFATDADADAIAFARAGVYPAAALANVPEELVGKYFNREGAGYEVKKRLRGLTVFGHHDLTRRAPFPRVDLVMCRNVLIYFTPELQRHTLSLFTYALRDGGTLVLGKSETTAPLPEFFAAREKQLKVYRRQGERLAMPPTLPHVLAPSHHVARPVRAAIAQGRVVTPQAQGARRLREGFLSELPVGVVVVDRRYDIQAINSTARRFLSIHTAAIGEDLIHIARGMPYAELRAAIDSSFRDGASSLIAELQLDDATTGEPRYFQITCYPQRNEGEGGMAELVTIVVADVTEVARARTVLERRQEAANAELERTRREAEEEVRRVRQETEIELARREALSQQVLDTNRQLFEANQEFAILNEELRAANEELALSAEEAQAAMEEVETLNEELQATNEELETLNEELQATVEELNATNEDLYARNAEIEGLAASLEAQYRVSEAARGRLHDILTQAPSLMAVLREPEHYFELVNPTFMSAVGRADGRLLGKTIREALPELESQGVYELLDRAYATGRPHVGTEMLVWFDQDGDGVARETYFDFTFQPLREADGLVRSILVQGVDRTEQVLSRRRTEELVSQLADERSRFEVVFSSIGDAVLAVDGESDVLFTNEAFRRMVGAEQPDEVDLGRLAPRGEDGEPLPPEATPWRRVARGESFTTQFTSVAPDGSRRYYEANGTPILGGERQGGVVVIRDTTERSLRRLQEEFIALASHELRTPLTPLQSYLQLLLRQYKDEPKDARPRRYVETSLLQVQHLSRLVDDLLDVTRLQTGRFTLDLAPVRLDEFVARCVETAQTLARGQTIRLGSDPAPVAIEADAGRLEQALLNLLGNAVTYAPGTESIDVSLRTAGGEVLIEVRDYGQGIPASDLPNLFSRFYQAERLDRPSRGGLGLGLYVSQQIVRAHGGEITVASEEGEGATFTIHLPTGAAGATHMPA